MGGEASSRLRVAPAFDGHRLPLVERLCLLAQIFLNQVLLSDHPAPVKSRYSLGFAEYYGRNLSAFVITGFVYRAS